jgi:hypothetical protein
MIDVSSLESVVSSANPFPFIAIVLIVLTVTAHAIYEHVLLTINRRTPPPVVGHLTQEQWLKHRHTFNFESGGSVVQWLHVNGLPPLNKEDYSAAQWERLATGRIGVAYTPTEYLPSK